VARSRSWPLLVCAGALAGASAMLVLSSPALPGGPPRPAAVTSPPPRPASPRAQPAVRTFLLGKEPPRERELPTGTVDVYEIDLDAGQYLHFQADQRGVDVLVDVIAPGRRLFKADSPNGSCGPEDVHVVAESTGHYRLGVAAVKAGALGRYLAQIVALRPASLADRERAAAQLAAAEAKVLAPGPGAFWEAAARYERALRLWEGLGDREPQVVALHELGTLYARGGRTRDALGVFLRSLALCQTLNKPHDEAVAQNELGRTYDRLGDFAGAVAAFEKALVIWRALGERPAEVTTLINMGIRYETHGQHWQALESFREAAKLAGELEIIKSEVNALNGMGWVYASVADWPRAIEAHRKALGVLNRSRERPLQTATLRQLGDAYQAAGEPEQALLYLKKALDTESDTATGAGALILDSMGLIYLQQDDYKQALDAFGKAVTAFERQSNLAGAADARINLGRTYLRLGQPEQALAQYGPALQQARLAHDLTLEAASWFGMAMAERDRGNLILAQAHAEAALKIIESLRATALRPDLKRSYIAWHETYFDLMVDILMARHHKEPGGGFARQAFAMSEQARARQLLDALASRRELRATRASAGPALRARWDRLTVEIDAQDLAGKRPSASAADKIEAERALQDLLDQLNELEAEVRRGIPGFAGRAGAAAPVSEPQPRKLLDSGTILLEYHLQEPHSFLWAISAEGGMQSFELPGRAEITTRVGSLVGLLNGTDRRLSTQPDAAERESVELGHILLGQVATGLERKRLAIAASGALQYLPFAALPDPGGREGPLVRWHEIVYVPSLAVLTELRERSATRRPPSGRLAIVADPVFGPSDERLKGKPAWRAKLGSGELPRLGGTAAEARTILALVHGGPVLEKTGFAATPMLLTGGELDGYGILHFATHGTDLASHPELSAIVLSMVDSDGHPQDGYLRAKDIARHEISADLVVLSACSTALGPEIDREGMFGLPQSFLAAGARQVLVSLWKVGENSTAELMQRFYRHLLADPPLPAGRALRLAQAEMWQLPQWKAPYHWAGFVLQGDWR
jgi:CHAT domain-containing protein/tetratricopeptide (TPR) repeat protein